jgi:tetratricopeptide (TPR) repeat protein
VADESSYEVALANGHSCLWEQRWEEAVVAFDQAAREFPERSAAYAGLGAAYFSLSQYEDALESYQLAARHSAGDVIYLRQIGDIYERLGKPQQAAETYQAIGEIEFRRRAVEHAALSWTRAVRLDPNLLPARQRLARYYAGEGNIPAAMPEFLQVARVYQERGDPENALRTCQLALRFDTNHAGALAAIEQLRKGEPILTATQDTILGPIDIYPVEAEFDLYQAGIIWATGEQAGAGSLLLDAQQLAADRLVALILAGAPTPVDDTSSTAVGLSGPELGVMLSQALDYDSRRQSSEAINCYERAIAGGVSDAAAHLNLGLCYQDSSRDSEAIREFSIAMQDQAFWLASHFALGESYRARGQLDDALKHFMTVLKTLDLSTVPEDQASRMLEQYDDLAQNLLDHQEDGRLTIFMNALVGFLSQADWKDKVQQARLRLDVLGDQRMIILGDLFTSGSAKVLEALYLSQEYEREGQLNAALEEAYRAIAAAQDYLPAHIRLAEVLVRQGRSEEAAEKYQIIGDTFHARGDLNGAAQMYEQAVTLAPLELSAYYRLIDQARRQQQYDRALEYYVALGGAQEQLQQPDRAQATYQAALKLAPLSSQENEWRVRLLRLVAGIDIQQGESHLALAAYRELRLNDPLDRQNVLTLVDLYFQIDQPEIAARELDHYFGQLIDEGREGEVPAILAEAVALHPTSIGLNERLVRLHLAQGQTAAALPVLGRLAELHLSAGETSAAADAMALIVKLDADNVARYHQLQKQLR